MNMGLVQVIIFEMSIILLAVGIYMKHERGTWGDLSGRFLIWSFLAFSFFIITYAILQCRRDYIFYHTHKWGEFPPQDDP